VAVVVVAAERDLAELFLFTVEELRFFSMEFHLWEALLQAVQAALLFHPLRPAFLDKD